MRAESVTLRYLGQMGRLGNQLFQIAAAVGLAHREGIDFFLPRWNYATFFQPEIVKPYEPPMISGDFMESTFSYSCIVIDGPTSIVGYFQSEKYFAHCADQIRRMFRPRDAIVRHCRDQFGEILDREPCSLHVRRGDYVKLSGVADLASTDYYDRAMSMIPAETTFLVFSDDVNWCRGRFRDNRMVFVEGQSNVIDLTLMSLCRHHIIANSSFSWWGAWLDPNPSKQVIAPGRWFAGDLCNPALPYQCWPDSGGFHDTRDLIPAGWTVI